MRRSWSNSWSGSWSNSWPNSWIVLLFAVMLACARPSSTAPSERAGQVEEGGGPPGAGGSDADPLARAGAGEGQGAVRGQAVSLDPNRIQAFATWIGENVEGERYRVPVEPDDVVFGVDDAPVTFTVFSDYQCPYCQHLDDALMALIDTYPTEVRVVMKHMPLAMHKDARPAAEAVLAAAVQGRGPQMHAIVFANPRTLTRDDFIDFAAQVGVPDLGRFTADIDQHYGGPQVDRDIALAQQLAVTSTPSFFVNGAPQRGAKTYEQLRELFTAELEVVDRLLGNGAQRHEVYASFSQAGATTREPPPSKPKPSSPRAGAPDPAVHYAVAVDGRPSRGPDDALVTIIEFADFECPYCRKVQATLADLQQRYGNDLRVVFRHQPLPMHSHAKDAALAAAAADRQGKFWEMHDLLFQAAEARQLGDYEALAQQLGLDLKQFRADMADPKLAQLIEQDQKVAKQFGASGTPGFFINGRHLAGAQPVAAFAALIDEELSAAKAYKAKHKVAGNKLYATMAKDWETEVETPPVAEHSRQTISIKDLPGTGKTNKPAITIVGCFDFDCPYCSRGATMINQVLTAKAYAGKVGYYALHFPLPMHKDAEGAHRAAIAAGEQGRFWEMHDLLFAEQKRRGMAAYEDMAKQLGLDLDRFRADWGSQATLDKINADKATCSQLGVSGTPTYFVNGRRTKGALPFDMMAEVLDEELAGGYEKKSAKKSSAKSK